MQFVICNLIGHNSSDLFKNLNSTLAKAPIWGGVPIDLICLVHSTDA